jgi:hypothetical protein
MHKSVRSLFANPDFFAFTGITVTAVSGQVAAVYTAYQSGSPCIHATTVGLSIWHVTR